MSYRAAGIDIHKKVLMVVVATAAAEVEEAAGEALEFECRRFGTSHSERQHLVSWLREHGVTEIVMESTAQYLEADMAGLGAAFCQTAFGSGAF